MTRVEMIEIVAEAIWLSESLRARGASRLVSWDEAGDDARDSYRSQTQFLIAALEAKGLVIAPKEPTDMMIYAGIEEQHVSGVPEAWSKATINIYRAMIGASNG